MRNVVREILNVTREIDLPKDESLDQALDRVEALLSAEHVEVRRSANSLSSTHIPFPIINIDKRLYSRRNWVGINPFIYLGNVSVSYCVRASGSHYLDVRISRSRGAVLFAFALLLAVFVGAYAPEVKIGVAFSLFVICVAYIMFFVSPARLAYRELRAAFGNGAYDRPGR